MTNQLACLRNRSPRAGRRLLRSVRAAFVLACVWATLPVVPAEATKSSSPRFPPMVSGSNVRALRELGAWDEEQAAQVRGRAERGDVSAQVEVGLMYFAGNTVLQNFTEALSWWKRAAEQGNPIAELNIGVMYQNGIGVPKDEAEAVHWYRRSAEHGDDTAQLRLAQADHSGNAALMMDSVVAAEWYRKAAEQGNALAQLTLGFLYRTGEGVMRDLGQAIAWSRRAAEQGNANAQFNLALAYRDGEGVNQSMVEAYTWAALAVENSSGETQQRFARFRDELTRMMTPAAITEAQTRARELHERLIQRRKL